MRALLAAEAKAITVLLWFVYKCYQVGLKAGHIDLHENQRRQSGLKSRDRWS